MCTKVAFSQYSPDFKLYIEFKKYKDRSISNSSLTANVDLKLSTFFYQPF